MRNSNPAYRSSAPAAVTSGPEYISKQIAAQWLGLSVRRVLELSNTGAIRRRQVTDPVTKRRQTVLLARDVQRAVIDGQKRLVAYRGSATGAGEVAAPPPPRPAAPGAGGAGRPSLAHRGRGGPLLRAAGQFPDLPDRGTAPRRARCRSASGRPLSCREARRGLHQSPGVTQIKTLARPRCGKAQRIVTVPVRF